MLLNVLSYGMELPEVNYTISDFMGFLGLFLGLSIFVLLALLIARFRSFLAALLAIPALVNLTVFVIFRFYEITSFFTQSENQFIMGLYLGIYAAYVPVSILNDIFVSSLLLINRDNEIYLKVIMSSYFQFIVPLFFFIIFFSIFRRKRRRDNRGFADDYF